MRRCAWIVALFACGDPAYRAVEPLPPGTELKLVAAWDGQRLQGALLPAAAPTRLDVADALEAGRSIQVWLFPLTRADLDAAIPGVSGLDVEALLAGVRPVLRSETADAFDVPPTAVVLETLLDDDASTALTFASTPRTTWTGRPGLPDIALGVDDALACRGVEVTTFDLPASLRIRALAAVDAERAFAVGDDAPATFVIAELRTSSVTTTTVAGRRSPRGSLSWDPTSDTLWGVDSNSDIYRVTARGEPVPFTPPPASNIMLAAAGSDGTVVALSRSGMQVPTHVLSRGTWTTVLDFTQPDVDFLRVAFLHRYAVYGNCWGNSWDLDETLSPPLRHWTIARAGDGNCFSRPKDLALDESQYLWLGEARDLKRSTEEGKVWPPFPHAIPITQDNQWAAALAAMGEERFAVAGKGGQLEVWIGKRWCVPRVDTPADWSLGSGAPGAGWFVGSGRGMRVRIAP